MPTLRKIDKLNLLSYETYFNEMALSETEKAKRIMLAELLEDDFIAILFLLDADLSLSNDIDKNFYVRLLKERYRASTKQIQRVSKDIENYIDMICDEIIQTTIDNKSDYYTSYNRAKNLAAEESNSVSNIAQYSQAVASGKKNKRWRTILDGRERKTHNVSDGQVVGIDEPFEVGKSKMMFPRDTSLGADVSEIAGCRCSAEYF